MKWGNLAGCGQAGNYTGGSGEAICATAGLNIAPFDTTVESDSFSLLGITSASLTFRLNYQDLQGGISDRLEAHVKVGTGPWANLGAWIADVGTFEGTGELVTLSLDSVVGNESVQIRFRYYDNSLGNDSGFYVQIDDVELNCTGGADLMTSASSTKNTFLEGENISLDFSVVNNGPVSATEVGFLGFLSPGINNPLLSNIPLSANPQFPLKENLFLYNMTNPVSMGEAFGITASGVVSLFPEVSLDVTTPPLLVGNYEAGAATFGPNFPMNSPFSGIVILGEDGVGSINDGCEPLTNNSSIAGNIALLDSSYDCDEDFQVLNAQKAGATAAIIAGEPGSYSILTGYITPLLSSGTVPEPVTIPSLRISKDDGDLFKANIVNTLTVQVQETEVLAQEQISVFFSTGKEVDPDFHFLYLFLGDFEGTNNISTAKMTVLKDSDGDGTADINEDCRFDPSKLTPGVCGCGTGELDTNANGIFDCLVTDEAQDSVSKLFDAVKALRPLAPGMKAKKKTKARERRNAAKLLLEEA
ncbi:MAG: hypothetical protein KDD55_13065, partial [Bdellovibrionales bacterium]|nr:hypothetical protein [Bdellovibrionales bacterium]